MSIDIAIILLLALSVFLGFRQGMLGAAMSPLSLVVTMLFAVQLGQDVGLVIAAGALSGAAAVLCCFLGIVSLEWLALFGLQRLGQYVAAFCDEDCIDGFLGGLLGLGRGVIAAWVAVAAIVAFEPQAMRVTFAGSVAAPRLLGLIKLAPQLEPDRTLGLGRQIPCPGVAKMESGLALANSGH